MGRRTATTVHVNQLPILKQDCRCTVCVRPQTCVYQDETDPAFRGRSLLLSWTAPTVNDDYGDFFGDGGTNISVSFCYVRYWSPLRALWHLQMCLG